MSMNRTLHDLQFDLFLDVEGACFDAEVWIADCDHFIVMAARPADNIDTCKERGCPTATAFYRSPFLAARSFSRSALRRMKPVASLWSYADASASIVAIFGS